jgi:two-component system, NtrC family, response regulator AtoC
VSERGTYLVVVGHGQLFTHQPVKDEIVIGRDDTCDLKIDSPKLSRRHAILRLGKPNTVQDLGSTNGVRVSRQTYRGGEAVALEPNEAFELGGYAVTIVGHHSHASDVGASSSQRSGSDRLRVDDPTTEGVPRFVRDVGKSATSVLILGESGVGKDVLAETLHVLSGRAGELARVNCAALAEPLIESELFGHEKGAFTGAATAKVGLLESAQGGSVFLDEIGELPLTIQAKLLRALESREVLRIGSIRPIKIDVRFIAATNRDLPAEVASGRFRHDLYFRLDGITLVIPPLRERRDRIATLATRFLDAAARRSERGHVSMTPAVLPALEAYDWPGNVRELKAVMERALLIARANVIDVRHLAFSPRIATTPVSGAPAGEESWLAQLTPEERVQRDECIAALEECAGNQTNAAKLLKISRSTFVARLKLFRIARPRS